MNEDFDVDTFCNQMQEQAKSLQTSAKDFKRNLIGKTKIELTINGEKTIHYLPCEVKNCKICAKINEIDRQLENMNQKLDDAFRGFDDFFGSW